MVRYVCLGGYPRWKDDNRPNAFWKMKRDIEEGSSWLFSGFTFME